MMNEKSNILFVKTLLKKCYGFNKHPPLTPSRPQPPEKKNRFNYRKKPDTEKQ